MSREAMKKTLKRLRSNANKMIVQHNKALNDEKPCTMLLFSATMVVHALITYVDTLEDAYSEFAEPFDEKIRKMKKFIEKKEEGKQKKEGSKEKPFYVK